MDACFGWRQRGTGVRSALQSAGAALARARGQHVVGPGGGAVCVGCARCSLERCTCSGAGPGAYGPVALPAPAGWGTGAVCRAQPWRWRAFGRLPGAVQCGGPVGGGGGLQHADRAQLSASPAPGAAGRARWWIHRGRCGRRAGALQPGARHQPGRLGRAFAPSRSRRVPADPG
ncbi:hypothetical protein SDC9_205749 [bioreactor metagenome]|uniref:Uncharacterized protein n=1 Tax=bioreactor metagenome TaxID=1076179 RepID=A0A645J356_9ZZZZ